MYAVGVTVETNFQTEVKQLLRDRVLDTTRELVCAQGWDAVNMSLIAKRVGVSRTALYKSVGAREELATALIQRETDRYLAGVTAAIAAADDAVSGLGAAARAALTFGAGNELLKSILSRASDSADDLLPLLTTDPEPVIDRAVDAVTRALHDRPDAGAAADPGIVDVFVRLTISHLLAPRGSIDDATALIHRTVAALSR